MFTMNRRPAGRFSDAPIVGDHLGEGLTGQALPWPAVAPEPSPGDEIKDRGEPGRVKHETPNQPDRTPGRVAGLPDPQFPSVARPEGHPKDVGKLRAWKY